MLRVLLLFAVLCVVSQVGAMPELSPIPAAEAHSCEFCQGLYNICVALYEAGDWWSYVGCVMYYMSACGDGCDSPPDPPPPPGPVCYPDVPCPAIFERRFDPRGDALILVHQRIRPRPTAFALA